ncbi:hypothetical protein GCM10022409_42590 [Hymenobacter glaciei]|uniref:TonB-dependent receptor plug domain-containing protein n=2 Tax=Hymenobacter glaciei TaxID=877209 RepID=A0ABP7USZ5_9BACT
MVPANTGRHCAACSHTVVDFTLKTDAEILAYLAGAASGRTCGRFAAGQLDRPLQRAMPVAPNGHWRAWLAAAVAMWGLREGIGNEAKAQAASEWRARYWGGPVPAVPAVESKAQRSDDTAATASAPSVNNIISKEAVSVGMPIIHNFPEYLNTMKVPPLVLRGVVTDRSTSQELPGVTVLLKGSTIGVSTQADGSYELTLPAEMVEASQVTVSVSSLGFITQERVLATKATESPQDFCLQGQTMGALMVVSPQSWHPRALYSWGKYWLTRPFRRD